MSRIRVGDTLLAALAMVTVMWPLLTLFAPYTWVRPALLMIGVVGLAGMAGRVVFVRGWCVAVLQAAAAALGASWLFGRGHLWHGLPTFDMVMAFNNLLFQARLTIEAYSAPAPTNRGVIVGIGVVVALFAIAVDYLAVTRRSPALAGLPLVTAYFLSAANTGEALPLGYFLAPAAVWLVMMGRQGVAMLRRWSTSTPLMSGGRSGDPYGTVTFASMGRLLGAAGLALAVALPMVLPHMPTYFLTDGLGRSTNGVGLGDDVSLSSTVDISRDLRAQNPRIVLTYTTMDPTPPPLRIDVLTDFEDGEWRTRRMTTRPTEHPSIPPLPDLAWVDGRQSRIRVENNHLKPPQLAAPFPLVSADLDGARWGLNANRSPRVASKVDSYEVSYLTPGPPLEALNQPMEAPASEQQFREELAVDPRSSSTITELAASIVPRDSTRLQAARLIQAHLRGLDYSYSLTLASPVASANGRPVGRDPISQFLATKQGYCVQYATAMVMVARSLGIPARMAIGFLPGSRNSAPTGAPAEAVSPEAGYTVRATDAHAWPELYFEGVGWLRFEPTPAARVAAVPSYSEERAETTPGGAATTAPTAGSSATRIGPSAKDLSDREDVQGNPSSSGPLDGLGSISWSTWLLISFVLALLGGLSVPAAARARHRRAVQEAADAAQRVEVEWQTMVKRIRDLGVAPPAGSTPRQAGQYLRHEVYLTGADAEALGRVVATLERSRYAPPGAPLPDIAPDTHAVVHAVSASRGRRDRLRARWLPQEGVSQWQDSWYAVTSAPSRAVAWARARLARRH
jgi:transglutaminase-like putative cysteine protease